MDEAEQRLLGNEKHVLWWIFPDLPIRYDGYPCLITADRKTSLKEMVAYPFRKNSQYLSLFDYHLAKILESGTETEYFRNQVENRLLCDDDDGRQIYMIQYQGVISAFAIFAIGCVVAAIILITENTLFTIKKRISSC